MDDHTVIGRVLTLLASVDDRPTTLAELTRRTGLPKATVRRLAEDLVVRSVLARTEEGYLIGAGMVEMAARLTERRKTHVAAAPFLLDLYQRERPRYVFLIDVSTSRYAMIDSLYGHGNVLAAASAVWPRTSDDPAVLGTAFGRVALAEARELAEPLLRRGVPRLTRYTTTDPRRLSLALERAAADGYVVEHEQLRLGWSCVATTVTGPAGRRAVLGAAAPTHELRQDRCLRTALSAAQGVSAAWRVPPAGVPSQSRPASTTLARN